MVRRLRLQSVVISLLLFSAVFSLAGINPNMAQSNSSSSTVTKASESSRYVAPGQTGIAVNASLVQSKGSAVNPQVGIQTLTNVTGPGGESAVKADASVKSSPSTGSYSFHIMEEDHSGSCPWTAINPKTSFLTSDYKAEVYFMATISSSYEVVFGYRSGNSRDWYVYYDTGTVSLSSGTYCVNAFIYVSGHNAASLSPRAFLARVNLDGNAAFDEFFDISDHNFSNSAFETATGVDSNGNPINPGQATFTIGSTVYAYVGINDAAYCSESGWGECRDTGGHVHDIYAQWFQNGYYAFYYRNNWPDYKNSNINYNYWGLIYDNLDYMSIDSSKVGTWDVYFYLDYYYDGGSYYWYGSVAHIQFTVQGSTTQVFGYHLGNSGGITIDQPGHQGSNQITATLDTGQTQSISLSCSSSLPSGAQCNFNPQSNSPTFTSTLTITTTTSTPSGTSTITVTGTGDGQPTTQFQLTIGNPTTRTVTLTSTSTSWTTSWTTTTSTFTSTSTSTTWTQVSSTSTTTVTTPTTTTSTSLRTTTTTLPAVTVTTTSTITATISGNVIACYDVTGASLGSTVVLKCDVQNTGTVAFPAGMQLWFYVSGPGWTQNWVGFVDASGQAVGTTTYSRSWTIPASAQTGPYSYTARLYLYSGGKYGPTSGFFTPAKAFTVGGSGQVTAYYDVPGASPSVTVSLKTDVQNTGCGAFPAGMQLWFYVTGPGFANWVGYVDVSGLSAGATQTYSFQWAIPSSALTGSYSYTASLWLYSAGKYTKICDPLLPAKSFTVSGTGQVTGYYDVTGASPGATVVLSADVQNGGSAPFPSGTQVWFYVTNPSGTGGYVGYKDASGQPVGTSTYSYSWTVPASPASGSYSYKANLWLYSGGKYTLIADFLLPAKAFAVPSYTIQLISYSAVPDTPRGTSATLQVQVKNTGTSGLPSNAEVWFYVDGPGWQGSHWVGYASIAGLAAGATQTYSISWNIPTSAKVGTYTYWAQAWYSGPYRVASDMLQPGRTFNVT